MKIKNAFQIFFKNYSLVLKVALTQLVFMAIIFGLGSLLINDMAVDVQTGLTQFGVIEKLNAVVAEITSGEFSAENFNILISDLKNSFLEWGAEVDFFYEKLALSSAVVLLFLMLITFCMNFYAVPFNQNLNDFMSTSAKTPFFWRFFKSIGLSAKTQLLYIVFPFLLDIFIVFGTVGLYTTVLSMGGLPGLLIAVLVMMVMFALRKTLFAFWIPAMVINQLPPVPSMKEGFKTLADGFGRVFWKILLTTVFTYALIAVILFGIVHLATVMVALFLMLHNELFVSTVSMVEYYKQSNFGFYIDKMKSVNIED